MQNGNGFASLQDLEVACERLYVAHDPAVRAEAETSLAVFSQSLDYVPQCQAILRGTSSPYAQMMVASSLLRLVSDQPMTVSMRAELRQFLLDVISTKGPSMEAWVVTKTCTLLARITKLGWFEDDRHRHVVEDASKFLDSGSVPHLMLGLRLLTHVVNEVNAPTPNRSLSEHRKVAVSFRDLALLKIFQLAVQYLRQLHQSGPSQQAMREVLLGLAQACLSFDFVGTCVDESSEDTGAIQVPSSWRPLVEDTTLITLFLDLYAAASPPLSCTALDCLVRLASVRRSLFSGEPQRQAFVATLVQSTLRVLETSQGLGDHDNYHNFCRLLGRLKTNYQLGEIVAVDCYPEWIALVAKLTVSSLQSWQWAAASIFYLLGLWSRLVSSVPYLKGDRPSLLDRFVPDIVEGYVQSRLESVAAVLGGAVLEDPLDSEEQIAEQMETLPFLFRFQYEKAAAFLQGVMGPVVTQYQQMAQTGATPEQASLVEGQLTWLCLIVGAVIRGRLTSSAADSQEPLDGALASSVLVLLTSCDAGFHATRYAEPSRQRLDAAILSFFQGFRKVYVGEQAMHASKVYQALTERLGLQNHLAVLSVMLEKIAKNLQSYRSSETVIGQTLELFKDLSDGYMSGKLLLKLEGSQFILTNHTADYFGFLKDPSNSRWRTLYYSTLARLLFLEDSPGKFRTFVLPLHRLLLAIEKEGPTVAALRQAVPKETLSGLFRDLRGIVSATNSRRTYMAVFDWLYPRRFPIILRSLEAFADVPDVTTPLLKFLAEMASNKTQRITFDASSASGILLFREVSKALVTYGRHALTPFEGSDVYTHRYKGIWICLTILHRALAGNYVNFGVFGLYGDPALSDALSMALKMALFVPLASILAYRKVGKAYFQLIEVLCHNHTRVMAAADTETFRFLLRSLEAGLKSLDTNVSSQCAAAIDSLLSFYFNAMTRGQDVVDVEEQDVPREAQQLGTHLQDNPTALPTILRALLEATLFEDVTNQWSLSRPVLPLILLNERGFQDVKEQLVASQRPERQATVRNALDKVMDDVQLTLEPRNRDKVTQNLAVLRHALKAQKAI